MRRTFRPFVFLLLVSIAVAFSTRLAFHENRRGRHGEATLQKTFALFGALDSESTLKEAQNNTASCPVVRTFRRYRIDLTRSSPKESQSSGLFGSLFGTWGKQPPSLLREKLKMQYPDDEILCLEDQSGIEAFKSLWQAAAKTVHVPEYSGAVIALPACDERILINWKELMDWIPDNVHDQVKIETIILGDEIPIIRIRRMSDELESRRDEFKPVATDETITRRTKAWVKRVLVDLSICPFTKSVTKSGQGLADLGVPVGKIAYHTSFGTTGNIYRLMADTWSAIHEMIQAGPSGKDGISSILLAAPHFDDDLELWCGPIFSLLENGVVAAKAEAEIGVVCFHPKYATPDGTTWPGFGQMHSVPRLKSWIEQVEGSSCVYSMHEVAAGGAWQRRSPHSTVNVLRANQLELAEARRKTPDLYARNIRVLIQQVGEDQLIRDLEEEQAL
jgi:hypothetical protein